MFKIGEPLPRQLREALHFVVDSRKDLKKIEQRPNAQGWRTVEDLIRGSVVRTQENILTAYEIMSYANEKIESVTVKYNKAKSIVATYSPKAIAS